MLKNHIHICSLGRKTKKIDLFEREYSCNFEDIVIICPTLRFNKIYKET